MTAFPALERLESSAADRDRSSRRARLQAALSKNRAYPGVVSEDVFRTVILRERKRADRFSQPLFLLVMSVDDQPTDGTSPEWSRVIDALAAVKRKSDVVGWLDSQSVLGIIVPDVQGSHTEIAEQLCRRFRQELETRLGRGALAALSIRLRIHPGPASDDILLIDTDYRGTHTVSRAIYPAVKRACDVVGSASLLLLLSPLLLLIAVLVRLNSRGPVLFRQKRVGHKERPFTMLKFRTMYVEADHTLHQRFVSSFITASNTATVSTEDAPFKLSDDPRVTRIGAVLRKTSADELPQLWNVLKGEMSLVGPRPPLDYEVERYAPWHRRRVMDVKPGVTGLWQVKGRSRTTFDQMVRLDLQYAKTCSLWSDVKILCATPVAVISGKGAR
jgi:lipopolysaccharide/colanic/teichoic acid biosynthesis glycosyltransferase